MRTTAYTHTESDHVAYGNRNALGGTLRAAGSPGGASFVRNESPDAAIRTADNPAPPPSLDSDQARRVAFLETRGGPIPVARAIRVSNPALAPIARPPVFGSAAADWSRWPVGTEFRLIATGQCYRVDDYGFALSGRNTIDLYQATTGEMNTWGVRTEQIEILRWGDDEESLRVLRPRQSYRHIRRMVLELEGKPRAAAAIK